MFVHNCEPSEAPDPSCCSDPRVMCPKCAAKALEALRHEHRDTSNSGDTVFNGRKPVPLGIPVDNFRRKEESEAKPVQNGSKRAPGKPVPLGIPRRPW